MGTNVVKLNLGGGYQKIAGYQNLDRKLGSEVYPLNQFVDGSVDEVRASHVLEHFPHGQIETVLAEWVRVLKPGGWLKIAVPDFERIVVMYTNGHRDDPIVQGYLYGGQTDENDFHKALFDAHRLGELLLDAGLTEIQAWQSEIQDCAALPVSLNLQGRKPTQAELERPSTLEVKARVAAVASVPRLGYQAHFGCASKAFRCADFDIPLWKFGGAFWEQGIQRGIEALIEDGCDWIITVDYDSLFDSQDVKELLTLAAEYPKADALIPWQAKRGASGAYLFSIQDANGKNRMEASVEEFDCDLTQVSTGHFGLTLLKTAALKRMPKPWFWSQPDSDGRWGDGRVDADIYFWRKFAEAGCHAFLANNIRIGHLEELVSWIDRDFRVTHQPIRDWNENGKPEACR